MGGELSEPSLMDGMNIEVKAIESDQQRLPTADKGSCFGMLAEISRSWAMNFPDALGPVQELAGAHAILLPAILAGLLITIFSVGSSRAQSEGPTADQVKAAYVYNFAKFVEWPDEVFSGSSGGLKFCVVGETMVGVSLTQITQGKAIGGHFIEVLLNPPNLRACQVVFLSSLHGVPLRETLKAIDNAPVLTVGESRDFAAGGGMIGLVMEDTRIRFEVNLRAAKEKRLSISSKLLSLAKRVL